MGIKLEKLALPSEAEIESLTADELVQLAKQWRQRIEIYQGLLFKIRRRFFGAKSERSSSPGSSAASSSPAPTARGETVKKPSDRYPEATIVVDDVDFSGQPCCMACGSAMSDSGMAEESEYLTVREKEFVIVNQRRHKHRCPKCHGSIATAPVLPRVIPGGSYGDDMIVDATLSKFCDLIPMERYCQMAGRAGFPGLPPHSLIQASLKLAAFLQVVYQVIRQEALAAAVLRADETPHRMLEGDAKKRWFLWSFSGASACFFECHDTRSGDVSTEVLHASACEVLVSDVYSGYRKSVRLANQQRLSECKNQILAAYCNAHARREFYDGEQDDKGSQSLDGKYMVDQYKRIYHLNDESKGLSNEGILEKRAQMLPIFEAMRSEALQKIETYSSKSQLGKAYAYFLNNYEGLTVFLSRADVPIDNNGSERSLRSPVVGRKTWYGTHSRAGAAAAAVHFTLVETCKLNKINPRQYYRDMIQRIHAGQPVLTPSQYKQQRLTDTC